MFTECKADVPIKLPANRLLIHGELEIVVDSGSVTIEFTDPKFADILLDQIRSNNLLALHLVPEKITSKGAIHLVPDEEVTS